MGNTANSNEVTLNYRQRVLPGSRDGDDIILYGLLVDNASSSLVCYLWPTHPPQPRTLPNMACSRQEGVAFDEVERDRVGVGGGDSLDDMVAYAN